MSRSLNRLTARQADLFDKAELPEGQSKKRIADGGNLYLVKKQLSTSWYFFFNSHSRRREYRIGQYPSISLADARKLASDLRLKVASGVNPLEERQAEKALVQTFGNVADEYLELNKNSWGSKTAWQWRTDLTEKCRSIRSIPVTEVNHGHLLPLLKPIWTTKIETANRLHRRIRAVLDDAIAQELIDGRNAADLKGPLGRALPKRGKVEQKHHKALHYDEVPALLTQVQGRGGKSARALELLALVCLRSKECRGARWDEIDFERRIWSLPGPRMKEKRPHRVPLSDRALEILTELKNDASGPHVFHSSSVDGFISDMSLWSVVRKLGLADQMTVHGLRTSFRTWVAERTTFPGDMAEMALAHQVGTDVERAYQRSDMLERRFELMQAWADHCAGKGTSELIGESENVIQFQR